MSFLLMVFLLLVCFPRSYPQPWGASRDVSILLTVATVLLIGAHAFLVSRRVSRPLARDPLLRDQLMARYERWRFIHQIAQYVLYGLCLGVFGWGWAVGVIPDQSESRRSILGHGGELLILLPFLAGKVLTWIFFYDADRAVHRAAYRALDSDPFTQNWLETRTPSVPSFGGRWTYVAFQLRQKLALVFIPVFMLIACKELNRFFPSASESELSEINLIGFVLLTVVFLCMPWLIRLALGLKPLPAGSLRDRLMSASHRLGFRCSDILLWNTRSGMANAMVIGMVPWVRYVVFTDKLIEEFPEDEVEAVFGHEVGHVHHHHMLFYLVFLVMSFVVLFMVANYLLAKLASLGAAVGILLPELSTVIPLDQIGLSGEERDNLAMILMMTLMVGYIFIVFGYLSRRCERQADVFGCKAVSCGDPNCLAHSPETRLVAGGTALCPTGIHTFVRALEKVAHVNGISRDRPGFLQSWQHSTIGRRVAFLRGILLDARSELLFQRRLALGKWALVIGLGIAFGLLLWHVRGFN